MIWVRRLLAWLLRRHTGAVCDGTFALAAARGASPCGLTPGIEPVAAIRPADTRARYRMRLVLSQSAMPDMLLRTLHRLSWNGGNPSVEANFPA